MGMQALPVHTSPTDHSSLVASDGDQCPSSSAEPQARSSDPNATCFFTHRWTVVCSSSVCSTFGNGVATVLAAAERMRSALRSPTEERVAEGAGMTGMADMSH